MTALTHLPLTSSNPIDLIFKYFENLSTFPHLRDQHGSPSSLQYLCNNLFTVLFLCSFMLLKLSPGCTQNNPFKSKFTSYLRTSPRPIQCNNSGTLLFINFCIFFKIMYMTMIILSISILQSCRNYPLKKFISYFYLSQCTDNLFHVSMYFPKAKD